MPNCVLDASALMALFQREKGSDIVAQAVEDGAAMSAVNLSEVVAKLNDSNAPEAFIRNAIDVLKLTIIPFDIELAYQAGLLRSLTKQAGLSLGDRACLALAERLKLPVLTTDKAWGKLSLSITIQLIR